MAEIFVAQWSHLGLISLWVSGSIYHIGWSGNYELWRSNPWKTIPIAHNIFDPHIGSIEIENNVALSGIYNMLASIGLANIYDIYNLTISLEMAAVSAILLASLHLIFLDSMCQWLSSFRPVLSSQSSAHHNHNNSSSTMESMESTLMEYRLLSYANVSQYNGSSLSSTS
jgi:hypothetical protein